MPRTRARMSMDRTHRGTPRAPRGGARLASGHGFRIASRAICLLTALFLAVGLPGCSALEAGGGGNPDEVPSAALRGALGDEYVSPFLTPNSGMADHPYGGDPGAAANPDGAALDPNVVPDSVRVDSVLVPQDGTEPDASGADALYAPALPADDLSATLSPAATDARYAVDALDPIGVVNSLYSDFKQETASLEVYALQSTPTLNNAAKVYSSTYPRLDFRFTIGMDEAATIPEALERLQARMQAGEGPDVLMLDGLPRRVFTQKGQLMDLSPYIPKAAYANIAEAYRLADGTVPAIPTRFYATTILGADTGGIDDLTGLADWLEDKTVQDIGIGPRGLMRMFLPIYGLTWMPDHALDEAKFRTDLEAMGRLARMFLETSQKNAAYRYNSASVQAYHWVGGVQAAAVGSHGSVASLAEPFSALYLRSGEFRLLSDSVFTPATILSVNAATENIEPAKNWIATLLSDAVQGTNFDDGFPIRRDILHDQVDRIPEHQTCQNDRMSLIEREMSANLHRHWPRKAAVLAFIVDFEKLTVPGPRDSQIIRVFEEGTMPYFLGEATLDQAVMAVRTGLQGLHKGE